MRASESIITIVENLVSQMTPVVTITANVDNGDGTFTLSMCPTYWLMPNMTITIDGNDYVIESFVQDTSITVSGSVQPAVTTFQLAAPEFRHGARRKVNNERQGDLRSVWVYLPIPEILEDNNPESDISYTADIRPIFLKDYNESRDTIELQQDEVIEPLNAAADYFVELINDDYATFNEPPTISRREWMNFGNPTVWGNDELIFDQPLSGVETRMSLEVLENGVCSCDAGEIDNCPDVTTSVEGVATTAETAPGQNIDIQIVDDIGNTVASTLITDTPNTKKLQVSTAGDPVQNSMNGTPLTEAEAGTTKTFTITYADLSSVTVTTTSDSATAFVGTVPNIVNTSTSMKTGVTTSYFTNDDGYTEAGRLTDWYNTEYTNWFGNNKRFTGIYGGYQDESDNLYYDKDGNLSTQSAEFPEEIIIDWGQWDVGGQKVFMFFHSRSANGSGTFPMSLDTLTNWIANEPYSDGSAIFSDWRTTNRTQAYNLVNGETGTYYGYPPINQPVNGAVGIVHTNTIRASLTSQNYAMNDTAAGLDRIGIVNSSSSACMILYRLATITEIQNLQP